jgi:hypothetical protein
MLTTTPYEPEDGPGVKLDETQIEALLTDALRPLYAEILAALVQGGGQGDQRMVAASYIGCALPQALRNVTGAE